MGAVWRKLAEEKRVLQEPGTYELGLVRDTGHFRPQDGQSRKVDLLGRKTSYG
jgi:hypothetical protein